MKTPSTIRSQSHVPVPSLVYLLSFSARDSSIDIRGLNVLVAQLVLDFLGVGGIEHMHSNGMP